MTPLAWNHLPRGCVQSTHALHCLQGLLFSLSERFDELTQLMEALCLSLPEFQELC